MHPILIAPLVEDRYWRCPLGEVTHQPYRLCRGCRRGQRPEVLDHAAASSRHSPLNACDVPKVLPFARVLPPLVNTSKGAEG